MNGFRIADPCPAQMSTRAAVQLDPENYYTGHAFGLLIKSAGNEAPVTVPVLHGRLVISASGWGLLEVPNALVRGLFDSMHEPGIELPPGPDGRLNAHISVFRKEDVDQIGGPDKITERGKFFKYQLGPMQCVAPASWDGISKVWFVKVLSPELQNLRKSYGLTPLPKNNEFDFHLTVAVKKKSILRPNEISKAAEERGPAEEYCPHCDARLERGDAGNCNRCGKPWLLTKAAVIHRLYEVCGIEE